MNIFSLLLVNVTVDQTLFVAIDLYFLRLRHPFSLSQSQAECRLLFPPPPSRKLRVTLNSHEVLQHVRTKAPCYLAGTDGLPTPNLSAKTKGDSNRKNKTEEKYTSPPSLILIIPPSIPAGRWGARAASVPLESEQLGFVDAEQQETWWWPSHFHSADFLQVRISRRRLDSQKCVSCRAINKRKKLHWMSYAGWRTIKNLYRINRLNPSCITCDRIVHSM